MGKAPDLMPSHTRGTPNVHSCSPSHLTQRYPHTVQSPLAPAGRCVMRVVRMLRWRTGREQVLWLGEPRPSREICHTSLCEGSPGSTMPLVATSCHLDEADVSRLSALCGSGALGTSHLAKKLPVPSSTPVTSNSCASLTQGCSGGTKRSSSWRLNCWCHNHL